MRSCGAKGMSQRARVCPFEHRDPRVVAYARVELAVADIEGDHPCGAPLEQHVAESAGRGTEVEVVEPGRVDRERVETCASLNPARETYGGGCSTWSAAASSTCSPGFACPWTSPAITSACACARLSARPRSTSRTSRRFFVTRSARQARRRSRRGRRCRRRSLRPRLARAAASSAITRAPSPPRRHVAVSVENVVDYLEEQSELCRERPPRRMLAVGTPPAQSAHITEALKSAPVFNAWSSTTRRRLPSRAAGRRSSPALRA